MAELQTRRMAAADLVYCGLFTALIAVGAFIKIMIPLGIWEVTFSLQFLFSLLAGFLLGPRRGLMSVISYLIIGLAGVPIFAHGGGPAGNAPSGHGRDEKHGNSGLGTEAGRKKLYH